MTKQKSSVGGFIALIVVLLIVGGGIYFYQNLGNIIKTQAEKIASNALGVEVNIGDLKFDANELQVTVSDIAVHNPDGFEDPYALRVGEVSVAIDDVTDTLLTFSSISVKDSELFLEASQKGTNLSTIQENIASSSTSSKKASEEKVSEQADDTNNIKVVIEKFEMSGTRLNSNVNLLGNTRKDEVTLPTITLTNIGKKSNGVVAEEAIAQIWRKISSTAISTSAKSGILKEIGISEEDKDNLKDKASGIVKGLFSN